MGTEVLRPQDCIHATFQISPSKFHHRRKNSQVSGNGQNYHFINNNYGYRKPVPVQTEPKRKFLHEEITNPSRSPTFDNFKVMTRNTKNNTNHNNDTVLRRGASLDSLNKKIKKDNNNNKMRNKARMSSNLAALEVPVGFVFPESMYAGSAFSLSPPPSDLPLPTFFRKQSFDDSATRDLRRLLRLE